MVKSNISLNFDSSILESYFNNSSSMQFNKKAPSLNANVSAGPTFNIIYPSSTICLSAYLV